MCLNDPRQPQRPVNDGTILWLRPLRTVPACTRLSSSEKNMETEGDGYLDVEPAGKHERAGFFRKERSSDTALNIEREGGKREQGPHIAAVTLAAYECGSVEFPEPPYPDQIVCPQQEAPTSGPGAEQVDVGADRMVGPAGLQGSISLWTIISKVRLEACMWGAGTAIGELPPYFMARAARLSGADPDDEDYQKFEEMLDQAESAQDFGSRTKVAIQKLIQKVGFFGILACASIPNPLFDLAGLTCGHFLVPFWTFFGATLIGKAVIKMHIQ
ncbi:hypothetical protein CCH79_00002210, partial [Gambusia affinis]